MKKLLSLLLTIAMTAMLLTGITGCAPKTEGSKDDNQDEFVTIEMWTGYPLGVPPKDFELVMTEVNKKLKEKLNCELDLKLVDWLGLDSTLNLKISAADPFDICFTSPLYNDFFRGARKDAFLDLTELLPEYAPTIWNTVDKSYWDTIKLDDKIYAVINNQIVGRQFCGVLRESTYNDYLKTSGAKTVDQMKTVEDMSPFLAYAKSISKDNFINATFDMDGIMTYWGFDTMGNWKLPGVVHYEDGDYKVVNQYDTDQWRAGMKLSKEWYDKGYYWPDMNINTPDYTRFQMRFAPTYKPGMETEEYQVSKYTSVFAQLGEPILFTNNILSTMNAISRTSKNPIRALKLLELLYSDKDIYNMLVFGLEGKHYTVADDTGKIKKIKMVENSDYSMPISFSLGNQYNMWIQEGQSDDVWDKTDEINKNAKKAVTFGFVFDPSPVKSEYATCTAVVDEYWYNVLIGLGRSDEQVAKSYQTFLTRLKQAGSDAIIAEKQKQLDAWRTANGKN